MALERFGLVIKAEGRYYPNLVTEQRDAMLVAADDGALTQEQRIILADRVITNADCYDVFWSNFCPNMRPTSVDQFVASAGAILLRIEESSQFKGRYSTSVLLRGPASVRPYVLHEGYSAVQAIHFGMRRWGIEQLRFLDELYQVGHGHHIFPIDVRRVPDGETIDQNLFAHLEFNGDWAMPRVGDLLLTTASKMKIPIASVRDRLQSWLTLFPGFVSPVRVSERMILEGRSKRIWELSLSGVSYPSWRRSDFTSEGPSRHLARSALIGFIGGALNDSNRLVVFLRSKIPSVSTCSYRSSIRGGTVDP